MGRHLVSRVVAEKGLAAGDSIALRDPSLGASRIFGSTARAAGNGEARFWWQRGR